MELAHSLLLNETALLKLPNDKKPVFVYEWLKFLDKVLPVASKADIKEKQEHILKILLNQLEKSAGPPTRVLLAKNLASIFTVGESYSLHLAINTCNDIVRSKDDSPSYLANKLAAITALGEIYNRLGRMVGRSYDETISVLLKSMKQAESQCRCQIMQTLQYIVRGLGSVGLHCHKDILKVTRTCLLDRSMAVRASACKCLYALVESSLTLRTVDVDSTVAMCLKTLEDSNYEVRTEMSKVLGFLLAKTQSPLPPNQPLPKNAKPVSLDDVFFMLGLGFAKITSSLFKPVVSDSSRGAGAVNREIRVGVTHALVEFARCMGRDWLERNLGVFLSKVLGLVSGGQSVSLAGAGSSSGSSAGISGSGGNNSSSHVEAVYARRCVGFVLRQLVSPQLGGVASQLLAGRELCCLLRHLISGMGAAASTTPPQGGLVNRLFQSGVGGAQPELGVLQQQQHVLICALQELACLTQNLNTAAAVLLEAPSSLVEAVLMPALLLPSAAVQLAAAHCLRCVAEALPAQQLPILVSGCLEKLHAYPGQSDAVLGHGYALAALLAAATATTVVASKDSSSRAASTDPGATAELGDLPVTILNKAEDMLRLNGQQQQQQQHQQPGQTNSQPSVRLVSARTQAAWLLLSACCSLGPATIRPLLPRLFLLWRNAFPRTPGDVELEKQRGDAFTWQIALESRSGALGCMHVFVARCGPQLLTEEVVRRLLPLLEASLGLVALLPGVCRSHGAHLRGPSAMLRLRLYGLLALLPPQAYNSTYTNLLRELVAEFTLTDNPANTTTSLLRSMCHVDDSVILGSWLQETDQKEIEDQLQPNSASGSGALEHDTLAIILCDTTICKTKGIVSYPAPLPLGVAVIDSSVQLFGQLFPRIQSKHRQQILEHFSDCIRQAKAARQQATQINIFTAVLCAMKRLADTKSPFGTDHNLKKEAVSLIFGSLLSPNPILRCAAGECLGRMAQVLGEASFVSEMTTYSFERLRSDRDAISRTGHSLALGCLHRYVGSLSGAGSQHLGQSVAVLLALAQDTSSPTVQAWSLHALALIADGGGPLFRRDYLELSLNLVLSLLLQTPPGHTDVHQCLGKVLGALITSLGPELQGGLDDRDRAAVLANMRHSCIVCCSLLQAHPDSLVQAEAVACLQQLHMFAPKHLNLAALMGQLYTGLSSCHLLLRRASVACLRQLSQKESLTALSAGLPVPGDDCAVNTDVLKAALRCHGLVGALFQMLDWESGDPRLSSDLEDTLLCLLLQQQQQQIESTPASSGDNVVLLPRWLRLLREVIQAGKSEAASNHSTVAGSGGGGAVVGARLSEKDEEMIEDDDIKFSANKDEGVKAFKGCRWPTKLFAVECCRRLLALSRGQLPGPEMLRHLGDLVSFAFIAATAEVDRLRLVGLAALQDVIVDFAPVREPEFPDQSILEQYQAQIGAALRPAFTSGGSGSVTAAACEVCSRWLASGAVREARDLARVQQLLQLCLDRARSTAISSSSATGSNSVEGLAVLRAWAELYVLASGDLGRPELRSFVLPAAAELALMWTALLRHYAELCVPVEIADAVAAARPGADVRSLYYSGSGGAATVTAVTDIGASERRQARYEGHWPVILHALALRTVDQMEQGHEDQADTVFLLLGLSMDAMCGLVSKQSNETIQNCLRCCNCLMSSPAVAKQLITMESGNHSDNQQPGNMVILIELVNVIHRLLLTRDCSQTHLMALQLLRRICQHVVSAGAATAGETGISPISGDDEDEDGELKASRVDRDLESGQLAHWPAFACAEVIICGLTRYIPRLLDDARNAVDSPLAQHRARSTILPLVATSDPASAMIVIGHLLDCMTLVIELTNHDLQRDLEALLPSILHLARRVFQLEVIRPSESRVRLPRAYCNNDTAPWRDRLQEHLADRLLLLLRSLLAFPAALPGLCDFLRRFWAQSDSSDDDENDPSSARFFFCVALVRGPEAAPLLQLLGPDRALLLSVVDRAHCLWQRLHHHQQQKHHVAVVEGPLPLLHALYWLAAIHHPVLLRFFARNLAELLVTWLLKLPPRMSTLEGPQPALVRQFAVTIDYLELLLDLVLPQRRATILSALIPLLILLLQPAPEELENGSKMSQRAWPGLHSQVLQRINGLAQRHAQPFRACIQQPSMAPLRTRLANAASQASQSASSVATADQPHTATHAPKIALKMDFSNFAKQA